MYLPPFFLQVARTVGLVEKDRRAIDAAVRDVEGDAREFETGTTHGGRSRWSETQHADAVRRREADLGTDPRQGVTNSNSNVL